MVVLPADPIDYYAILHNNGIIIKKGERTLNSFFFFFIFIVCCCTNPKYMTMSFDVISKIERTEVNKCSSKEKIHHFSWARYFRGWWGFRFNHRVIILIRNIQEQSLILTFSLFCGTRDIPRVLILIYSGSIQRSKLGGYQCSAINSTVLINTEKKWKFQCILAFGSKSASALIFHDIDTPMLNMYV